MSDIPQHLYKRISDDLRAAILSRSLGPGDTLPSEHELASRYEASRVTVRKALNVLCSEHLITSHQGKGYFVREPDYGRYELSFSLIRPEHRIRRSRMAIVDAAGDVAERLSLREGSPVIYLQLVILADALAVACEDKYLPYRKGFPTIESVTNDAEHPELVNRKLPQIAMHCDLSLGPGRLDEEHASLLGCGMDEPVLIVRRIIEGDVGRKLMYSLVCLRETYGELSAASGYSISKPAAARPEAVK